MNVIVMAGTSDSVRIIEKLGDLEDIEILATTTTKYGAELARSAGAHDVISHGLRAEEIVDLINKRNIDLLVDATHPFAVEATKNALNSVHKTGIKYLRFERPQIVVPENEFVHKVQSFEDAAAMVIDFIDNFPNKKIMHLAGVSTVHYLTELMEPGMIIVRVVPSAFSIRKCLEMGFPGENIIAMQGTFSKEFNKTLMKEYDVSLVVTKESGESGGTPSKIEAAIELRIPIIIVVRPEVSELENESVFSSIDDLCDEIMFFRHVL
ncbi:MAG: precorrin-6A reductase [Methanobacterium paludis]|nr:precorrin-6A reductase [Methanobacterium paludis]